MRDPGEGQIENVEASDAWTGDPIIDLILNGAAKTAHEAEELYLDTHVDEILRLVESALSERDFRSHPLIQLLLARGSPPLEDSLR
jgi:hypothetical protein